jgi:hypothetical protein
LIFVDNASDRRHAGAARGPSTACAWCGTHTNLGWGASGGDGIAAPGAECIVIVDADLEYPPEAIPTRCWRRWNRRPGGVRLAIPRSRAHRTMPLAGGSATG